MRLSELKEFDVNDQKNKGADRGYGAVLPVDRLKWNIPSG